MPSATIRPTLSLESLQRLATQPEHIPSQVVSILASMASEEEEVRAYANDCLEQVEVVSVDLLPQLAPFCCDLCAPLASWACKLVGRIGSTACQLPLVTALRSHESIGVKQQAALSLSKIPELQPDTLAALAVAAQDADPRLQRIARQALNGLS